MSKNSYESLNNERDESCSDDANFSTARERKDKRSSLRIRLNRVFSSGPTGGSTSPKSPIFCSASLTNSRGSSPGCNDSSPIAKTRYSWQSLSLACKDNRLPDSSSPKKFSSRARSTEFPASPKIPKSPESPATWYETRMKYSPQQQQKERKSESESIISATTPSRDLKNNLTKSGESVADARQDSSVSSRASRFSVCRSGNSTGMFAWMRVFRLATMLHQIDC